MILLVDNYDSFTYNLAHLFGELGAEVVVRRNDAITPDEAEALAPTHLVVSPGPGRPADAGATIQIVRRLAGRVPIARRLPRPPGDRRGVRRRGRLRARARARQGDARLARRRAASSPGSPDDFLAGRYHSLAATSVPDVLRGLGDRRRRRGDGRPPPRAADRRRPVPSRVGADAGRAATSRRTSWRRRVIQDALARLLDGHDLSRDEARGRDGPDHVAATRRRRRSAASSSRCG